MLTQLSIRGLAIIDQLDIEFSNGLNVITGETGAGKSILIRALNLLMGSKASVEHIRSGCDQASVIGVFDLHEDHPAFMVLDRLGIKREQSSSKSKIPRQLVLLRRNLQSNGRSFCWINDIPVSVSAMQEVGQFFVDVFGQHEHQKILDSSHHVRYIDQFSKDEKPYQSYRDAYENIRSQTQEFEELIKLAGASGHDIDYLSFRLKELDDFAPSLEDYEHLLQTTKTSKHFQTIHNSIAECLLILDGDQTTDPLAKNLRHIQKYLEQIEKLSNNTRWNHFSNEVQNFSTVCQDLSFELQSFLEDHQMIENIEKIEDRLAQYQALLRKFNISTIAELSEKHEALRNDINRIQNIEQALSECLTKISAYLPTLSACASTLERERSQAFERLKMRVEKELKDLAMSNAKIELDIQSCTVKEMNINENYVPPNLRAIWEKAKEELRNFSSTGRSKYQFLMTANKGEKLLPLNKIASGGEVSRIMLALKRGVAMEAGTCVMVFDEIDTGISGKVADMVGSKLKDLAKNFQVICISHLPQVAAHADHHFIVEKKQTKNQRTESVIRKISHKESILELARLLSGSEVTEASIAHAELMKAKTTPEKVKQ